MGKIRIAINGFGRIGRMVFRRSFEHPDIEVVAINGGGDAEYMAYQLKYDTVHGRFNGDVQPDGDALIVNGKRYPISGQRDPSQLKWGDLGADYIVESTGKFLTRELCAPHLAVGAKKVVMSAPAKDDTQMFVYGVNEGVYTKDMDYVSNASCTTNCLAPLAKVINNAFGIESGLAWRAIDIDAAVRLLGFQLGQQNGQTTRCGVDFFRAEFQTGCLQAFFNPGEECIGQGIEGFWRQFFSAQFNQKILSTHCTASNLANTSSRKSGGAIGKPSLARASR